MVEDSPHKTPLVTDFLAKSGLTYTHLHVPTAKDRKLQEVGRDTRGFVETSVQPQNQNADLCMFPLPLRATPAG